MKKKANLLKLAGVSLLMVVFVWVLAPRAGHAHCDTLDGPVVTAARVALDRGDVTAVLKWVQKKDEGEIKKAFENTIAVRKLSPQAKDLADMYFFETLVRIHRAAEGAGYTGLKPAGSVEPPIAAADNAIDSGSLDDLAKEISTIVIGGMRQRFERVMATKKRMDDSIQAGREYVEAYVEFVHYVERLHNDALGQLSGHDSVEVSEPAIHQAH